MVLSPADVTVVILAGGFGTRIKQQLPDLPKPLAPVAGRPFLDWQLRYLQQQGFRRSLVSTGYLAEKIATYAEKAAIPGMAIACVAETVPLGTAGGFLNAVNNDGFDQPTPAWLVLNGDSLIVTDYRVLLAELGDNSVDGVILGVNVPDTSRFGSLKINDRGELEQFAEKQAGAGVINSGVYLLGDRLLAQFPPQRPLSFEYDVFPTLLNQGAKIKVHAVDAPFLDIGTPETLAQGGEFIQSLGKLNRIQDLDK
ncbi:MULTISPECIES: nucleotidyltransferase family protein [unclassified Synechocystis]|uniref:nucleotidyltransferase family protein n=1 Tax=unclassified Synechocystis TaxID=2640012 RepID=UPI00040E2384|nr:MULTISPECIES: nucleotidyltransferase family protein [unclassified Synechocystis]AIE75846.1 D-glycero-D-manno-heptose 1-phosphate guanosyltransferase [Synechocystis sp. PCC 6714]MCT0255223.1 nucleotidyltransferase family protein [Synechocystis sp. CS-94]